MEALKSVEADSDDVVTVVEKAEMSDDQLLARLPLAFQVSGSGGQLKRKENVLVTATFISRIVALAKLKITQLTIWLQIVYNRQTIFC